MWNARSAMKQYLTFCLASGLLVFSSQAQQYAAPPSAPETTAPKPAPAASDDEAYAALLKSELELGAQFKLLAGLAQELGRRADEATKGSQLPKAAWENELAKELGEKSQAVLKQFNEATKQRLGVEGSHTNVAVSLSTISAATAGTRVSPVEYEFLTKLGERMDRVNQDLTVVRQYSYDYAERLRTNALSYDYQRAAIDLEQNARKVRQLEQELSDLELRKLEFQALRRP
jgi:hypothetical protein